MKIYLASKYTSKERIREIRKQVEAKHHTVTSHWLEQDYPDNSDDELKLEEAKRDILDVIGSDLLILDTFDESITGGREVEFGLAIGLDKKVWLVGPIRNVFHLAVKRFESWDECLAAL